MDMKDGGPSQLAFTTMTGGLSKTLYTKPPSGDSKTDIISKMELFKHIKNALSAGLIVTTAMDKASTMTYCDKKNCFIYFTWIVYILMVISWHLTSPRLVVFCHSIYVCNTVSSLVVR